jgi:hypothetical protein
MHLVRGVEKVGVGLVKVRRQVLLERRMQDIEDFQSLRERVLLVREDALSFEFRFLDNYCKDSRRVLHLHVGEMNLNGRRDKILRRFSGDDVAKYILLALPQTVERPQNPTVENLWDLSRASLDAARLRAGCEIRLCTGFRFYPILYLKELELLDIVARQTSGQVGGVSLSDRVDSLLEFLSDNEQMHSPEYLVVYLRPFLSCLRCVLNRSNVSLDITATTVNNFITVSRFAIGASCIDLIQTSSILSSSIRLLNQVFKNQDLTCAGDKLFELSRRLAVASISSLGVQLSQHGMLHFTSHALVFNIDDICIHCLAIYSLAVVHGRIDSEIIEILKVCKVLHAHRLRSTFVILAYLEALCVTFHFMTSFQSQQTLQSCESQMCLIIKDSHVDVLRIISARNQSALLSHRCMYLLRCILRPPFFMPTAIESLVLGSANETVLQKVSGQSSEGSFLSNFNVAEKNITFVDAWYRRELDALLFCDIPSIPKIIAAAFIVHRGDRHVMEQALLFVYELSFGYVKTRQVFSEAEYLTLIRKHLAGVQNDMYLLSLCELCIDILTSDGEW